MLYYLSDFLYLSKLLPSGFLQFTFVNLILYAAEIFHHTVTELHSPLTENAFAVSNAMAHIQENAARTKK